MAGVPSKYRAAVVEEFGDSPVFATKTLPIPKPGPSEVLVKLSASGVCGTDAALASGHLGPTRSILGHEGVGRVVALGSELTEKEVRIGQRVGIAWIRDACGTCAMCLHPDGETRCLSFTQSGRTVDGTFAEYTIVPYRYITTIPEGLTDEQVAPILCGGLTIYKGLKICGATPGQWVAISGAGGGVGSLGIQYANAMGYRVLALDAGEEKRRYCLSLGAEVYIDVATSKDATQAVQDATEGLGVGAVLVVAGNGAAYNTALGMLAPFGTLVCIGIPPPDQALSFHPIALIDSGVKIIGSSVGTRGDIIEALEFVKRGKVIPTTISAGLDDVTGIVKKISSGQAIGKYVVKL